MATEIDLPWTYVGGPAGLIERLVSDDRIEAMPAGPQDHFAGVEDWVTRWAARTQSEGDNGVTGSGSRRLRGHDDRELRHEVGDYIAWNIVGLV